MPRLLPVLALMACAPAAEFDLDLHGDAFAAPALPVDMAPPPGVLSLQTGPWVGGSSVTTTVGGAAPGDMVALLLSSNVNGAPACPSLTAPECLGIAGPVVLLDQRVADASGEATFQMTPPDPVPVGRAEIQGVVLLPGGGADTSNVVLVPLHDANSDLDADGLLAADEVALYGTDPGNADSDGGGAPDGTEVAQGTDPLDPADDGGSASCALSATNALRVECSATLPASGHAVLELSAAGAPTRTFASEVQAVDHDLLGWGLLPNTVYDWTLAGAAGQITTGALPADLAGASITTSGALFGIDAVLQPLDCSDTWFVMIDEAGQIIWYDLATLYGDRRHGYQWSQADRSIVSNDFDTVVEQHVSGAELMRLERFADFDEALHHDVDRWGPYTYLLFEENVSGMTVDGVYVFDGTTLAGTFRLADWWTIPGGGGEWSHANGINTSDSGELVMSLRNFDTVLGFGGDPLAADFLDLTFVAGGSARALVNPSATPNYVPAVGPDEGFAEQHNGSRVGADELWLFDNTGTGSGSRATRYLLDDVTGEVRLDAEWGFSSSCSIQGGSVPIPGGVLATCATVNQVHAFQEGSTSADWTLNASCSGSSNMLIRGQPVLVQ